MQQGFDGEEEPVALPVASRPISQLCSDPGETRARAELGEPTPCHRCLAYVAELESGCIFVRPKPNTPDTMETG